mgnify:CR=1 FL=1
MSPVLFALALFGSAALLFSVQPVAGKVLLPLAGGTPAVWTTCLVFFQSVLLLGYLYADRLSARLAVNRQVLLHLAVGGVGLTSLLLLAPDPAWVPDDAESPVFGLAAYLAAFVGLPFFALSATAPLLQKWFAATGHRSAADPYFLYAASNAGSLLGLLAYPFAVEPNVTLGDQRTAWVVGYVLVLMSVAVCGWVAMRNAECGTRNEETPVPRSAFRVPDWLKWVFLAALPSSLLMSATAHLTTDVAPVPLLWVVPLGLYLVSFVIVFARWPDRARFVTGRVAPMLLIVLALALLIRATEPLALVAGIHLAALFAVSLQCHGQLAADRPGNAHLTRFYLAMSVGGVLGGVFNAVVAPVLFANFGLVEYPLAIVLAALVRPRLSDPLPLGERVAEGRVRGRLPEESGNLPSRDVSSVVEPSPHPQPLSPKGRGENESLNLSDGFLLVGFAAVTLAAVTLGPRLLGPVADPAALDPLSRLVRAGLTYGLPAAVAFALVRKPARFAACLAVLFLVGRFDTGTHGEVLLTSRNFFGTLQVTKSHDGRFVRLAHGTTLHGQQRTDERGRATPLMYYHPTGPIGRLFAKLPAERKQRVGAIGLGCGAMAAYAEPGQAWTFFEIDPGVVRIARDSGHFTFLRDARAEQRIVLGDARRLLAREPDGSFDFLVLDAFSSDAIPAHLLTREAFAMYTRKLAPHGVIAFHLSNRYLDLPPLVARLGAACDPPFQAKVDVDGASEREAAEGKFPSTWVVLYRNAADLGPAGKDTRWQPIRPTPGPVWTDDFSNLLGVWKRDEN